MLRPLAIVASLLCCLAACGLRDTDRWQGARPAATETRPGEAVARARIVLFAPVALGDLAAIHPAARLGFAADLADRVDLRGSAADADGMFGEALPDADADAWKGGPVAAAAGADFILLTSITALAAKPGSSTAHGQQIDATATAELRALDPHGNVVFATRSRGDWSGVQPPKLNTPGARPEALAAWDACANAADAFLAALARGQQPTDAAPSITAPAVVAPLIEVAIGSDPAGADVLVDGVFRGNTPCTLRLPARPVALRLELAGRRPWERTLTPEAGMRVQPALVEPEAGGGQPPAGAP
jgi:hypothetical protein